MCDIIQYVHCALILCVFADDFSDDTVNTAIQNEMACNPVLRAQANGILSLVDSYVKHFACGVYILALYPQLSMSCVYRNLT